LHEEDNIANKPIEKEKADNKLKGFDCAKP